MFCLYCFCSIVFFLSFLLRYSFFSLFCLFCSFPVSSYVSASFLLSFCFFFFFFSIFVVLLWLVLLFQFRLYAWLRQHDRLSSHSWGFGSLRLPGLKPGSTASSCKQRKCRALRSSASPSSVMWNRVSPSIFSEHVVTPRDLTLIPVPCAGSQAGSGSRRGPLWSAASGRDPGKLRQVVKVDIMVLVRPVCRKQKVKQKKDEPEE